jgi:RHS repeat-associated protein
LVSGRRAYDAFGNVVGSTGTWQGPFSYGGPFGYQTDGDSGLLLLGHRYYDPTLGRFLSRDPIGDGRNWYAYCANNPVRFADPEGTVVNLIIAAIAVAAVVMLFLKAREILKKQEAKDENAKKVSFNKSLEDITVEELERYYRPDPHLLKATGELTFEALESIYVPPILHRISRPIGVTHDVISILDSAGDIGELRKMGKEWADVDREIEDYLKGKGALPPESNPVSYPTVGGGMHWVYRLGGRRPHVGVMP